MVPSWQEMMMREAWATAQKIREQKKKVVETAVSPYSEYEQDPVGFCTTVLGDKFTEDVIEVVESVAENPVTIARSANGTGKTHSAARIAIWFFLVFPDSKVFVTAAPPADNLKKMLWGEIMGIVRRHPELFRGFTITANSITRHSESFISTLTIPQAGTSEVKVAKFSGKHAPHLLFIVDEGDGVPDECYTGIESCMSGGEMARLLIMFNPKITSGIVYTKEVRHQANVVHLSALRHPNVITGKDVIPGAATRSSVIRRINEWTFPVPDGELATEDIWEVPDFLVGLTGPALDGTIYPPLLPGKRKVTEPSFWYMVLGEYPQQSDTQLISDAWISAARSRWDAYVSVHGEVPPLGVSPLIGVDVAEYGKDANTACVRWGGFVGRMYSWQGVDASDSADKALSIAYKTGSKMIMVDGTGVGSTVAPLIARRVRMEGGSKEEKIRAISVKVGSKPSPVIKAEQGEFYSLRDQLWWAVREWLRTDPGAMLPPDHMLLEELKVPTYAKTDNGRLKIMKKEVIRDLLKRSSDRADALCMTFLPIPKAKVLAMDFAEREDA